VTEEAINHPKHYNMHESGIEAIDICEHLGFNIGNAVKYLFRAGYKGDAVHKTIEDMQKARWYLERQAAQSRFTSLMNGTVPYLNTATEGLIQRVCACTPSTLTRVLAALFGARDGEMHVMRDGDLKRAIDLLTHDLDALINQTLFEQEREDLTEALCEASSEDITDGHAEVP